MARKKREPDVDMTKEDEVIVPDEVLGDDTLVVHVDDMPDRPTRKYSPAERRRLGLALRMSGATYQVIADQLGVSRDTAIDDVKAAMLELGTEDMQALRVVHQARLEQLLGTRWAKALNGDDSALVAVLSILDRIERLYGLNGVTIEDPEAESNKGKLIVLQGSTSSYREELEADKRKAMRA